MSENVIGDAQRDVAIKVALCRKMREIHGEKMMSDCAPDEKAVYTKRAQLYCEMYGGAL